MSKARLIDNFSPAWEHMLSQSIKLNRLSQVGSQYCRSSRVFPAVRMQSKCIWSQVAWRVVPSENEAVVSSSHFTLGRKPTVYQELTATHNLTPTCEWFSHLSRLITVKSPAQSSFMFLGPFVSVITITIWAQEGIQRELTHLIVLIYANKVCAAMLQGPHYLIKGKSGL